VFFVAIRNDIDFDLETLDMSFNYEPVLFKEAKEGIGEPAACYELLCKAKPGDKCLADILIREEGRNSRFNEMIVWDDTMPPTVHTHGFYRGDDKTKFTDEDYRNCGTFPQDYDWNGQKPSYIVGMSVPPIMMKRVVTRLIEKGVFNYDK
jgi:DNA (cytosine-5)-methyltransferase 1